MSEEEYVKGYNDGLDTGKIYLKNARESLLVENENLRKDLEDTKSLLPNKHQAEVPLRPTENYDWWCVSIMERRKRVAAEKENEKLRKALVDCAIDLEVEINARYHDCNGKVHPALQRKYDNDMSTVIAATKVIEEMDNE